MMINTLNLPNLKIIDMEECIDDYRFLVEMTSSPSFSCPNCGTIANLVVFSRFKNVAGKQATFFII